MDRFVFYRITRDCGRIGFEEVGCARYEEGRGTVVKTADERLAWLLSRPIEARQGAAEPHPIEPDDRRYLAEAANGLYKSGYIGRLEGGHAR